MLKATLRGLLAHKLRLALTGLAIVLGVTFVTGTFVLTDTLRDTFTSLFGHVYQNVDFQVRGVAQFSQNSGGSGGGGRQPIPQSLIGTIEAVPGVSTAVGEVQGYAEFVDHDGKAISTGGAPNLGLSYNPNETLSQLKLVAGHAPDGPHQVVMDLGTAQKDHFAVGDQVRVLLPGAPETFTISGLVRFGTANNLAGATIAAFDLPVAQQLFDEAGHFNSIDVLSSPGADKGTVQHAIAAVLPRGVQVVTGQTLENEATNSIDSALGFFSTALLVFAFISLFVGGFTIFNTFSITVGQRTRELALLRILGASRKQLFRSVVAEAVAIGLAASLVGLGLGVLTADGLEALLGAFGITLPSGSLVFEARTVIVSIAIGVGVTVISAVGPARRAVRIPAVAALNDRTLQGTESSRRRMTIGGVVAVIGIAALVYGLAKPLIQFVGVGAAAIFIAAAMLAPLVARPMSSALGRPLARLTGVAGKLGRENSMRSPRRTAQTASALMVGLALVSTFSVFGASVSKSATSSIDNAVSADYIITTTSQSNQGFSNALAPGAATIPGVNAVSSVYGGTFEVNGSLENLGSVTTKDLAATVILNLTAGTLSALSQGDLFVDQPTASTNNYHVGSVVTAKFARTGTMKLRIGGIYKANGLLGSYNVSNQFFLAHFDRPLPVAVLLRTSTGPTAAESALIDKALAAYANVQIQTRAQFEKSTQQMVNKLLGLIDVLLALAIIIALIGIVNTLLLSVFERTHEIGLLRAVGMRRRQIRLMIRCEGVILALFGAVIGILLGTALGVALAVSLKQQGIVNVAVPVESLIRFLILAGIFGIAASTWPARRAAKLDVLAAIAAD